MRLTTRIKPDYSSLPQQWQELFNKSAYLNPRVPGNHLEGFKQIFLKALGDWAQYPNEQNRLNLHSIVFNRKYNLLDHITWCYQCKIPRKAEFTIADLICAINRKLKGALKTEYYDESGNIIDSNELKDLIDTIPEWIRNQVGAHFNIDGMEISNPDVNEFAEATLNIADALVCPDCGEMCSKRASGSYWECTCGKTRMHPLEIPR